MGDQPGHEFRGNQYAAAAEAARKDGEKEAKAALKSGRDLGKIGRLGSSPAAHAGYHQRMADEIKRDQTMPANLRAEAAARHEGMVAVFAGHAAATSSHEHVNIDKQGNVRDAAGRTKVMSEMTPKERAASQKSYEERLAKGANVGPGRVPLPKDWGQHRGK